MLWFNVKERLRDKWFSWAALKLLYKIKVTSKPVLLGGIIDGVCNSLLTIGVSYRLIMNENIEVLRD